MEELFRSRPFKIRNADEYEISTILSLFVNPISGLASPYDYENTIIKGRMGSGKTMYLRANYAYYLFGMVASLLDQDDGIVLPIMIKLSDFQHLSHPNEIYKAIIIKIIEEMTSVYLTLENAKNLAALHKGLKHVPDEFLLASSLSNSMRHLARLGSEEYIERVSRDFGLNGGIKPKFFQVSAEMKTSSLVEIKRKPNPGMKDIEESYNNLLSSQNGKILLLIDEAGSLDKSFFISNSASTSFFEIIMNQFRTAPFIRTKIAVYPNSYSDLLTETRYGDAIVLEESVETMELYKQFRQRVIKLIENYLNPSQSGQDEIKVSDVFEVSRKDIYGDSIEQLMYASGGNIRRLIQLLDVAMDTAYMANGSACVVTKQHVLDALKRHANSAISSLKERELDLLETLASVCKSRSSFKFTYPNVSLYNLTGRSQEYNLINVVELGVGRRASTYSFDYSYCVLKDIPTHRMKDTESVYSERSLDSGRWLARVANVSKDVIANAELQGKIEGVVDYVRGDVGFVTTDDGERLFFRKADVIESDTRKPILLNKRLRFFPENMDDIRIARLIEVL